MLLMSPSMARGSQQCLPQDPADLRRLFFLHSLVRGHWVGPCSFVLFISLHRTLHNPPVSVPRCPEGMVVTRNCTPGSDIKCVAQESSNQTIREGHLPREPVTLRPGQHTTPSPSSGSLQPGIYIAIAVCVCLLVAIICVCLYRNKGQGEAGRSHEEALALSAGLPHSLLFLAYKSPPRHIPNPLYFLSWFSSPSL